MNTLRSTRLFSALLLTIFSLLPRAGAQTFTAELSGTVTDPSGAVVANAAVRAVNVGTNGVTETRTNELGYYKFPYLPPATYQVEVEMAGFKKLVRKGIELHVNQEAQLPLSMEIGQRGELVTITAEAPLLDAASSTLGAVVTGQTLVDMPLNNRQVYQLAQLTPGVIPSGFSSIQDPARFNQAVGFSSQGAQRQGAKVLVDGMDVSLNVSNPSFQGVVSVPSVDSVEEFKVQSNSLSAEFGRTGGGVINVVIKSGTNDFHGGVFEFLRNSKLDANSFFANRQGIPLTSFKRNQYGANLGGPVRIPGVYDGRNKTFFFFGFEKLNERLPRDARQRVPTELERAGDFSQTFTGAGALIQIYDPFNAVRQPNGTFVRPQFPGNRIPTSRFNPVSVKAISYYPTPNSLGIGPAHDGNYAVSKTLVFDTEREDLKIDQKLSETRRLMGKYSRYFASQVSPNFFNNVASAGASQPISTQSAGVDYTQTLGPTLVINAAVGANRLMNIRTENEPSLKDVTALGLPAYLNANASHVVFPNFMVAGFAVLGNAPGNPLVSAATMYTARVSLSKFAGRHSIKTGFEWEVRQVSDTGGGTPGAFAFNVGFTQGPNPLLGSPTAGNGLASLLLGIPANGSLNYVNFVSTQNHYFGGYLQDDIRLTQRLTLNLGARYEVELPRTERWNRGNFLDLNIANPLAAKTGLPLRGGLRFVGVDGNSRYPFDTDYNNIAPRVGFAYQAQKQTVIRAGYGLVYSITPIGASGALNNDGFAATTPMVATVDGVTPFNTISNPFPDGFIQSRGAADGLLTDVGQGLSSVVPNAVTPFLHQWNLNLQRQLPGGIVVEAAYAGSRGMHLQMVNIAYDQLPNQYLALGNTINDLVANPFAGSITQGTLSQPQVQRKQLLRPYPQFTNVVAVKPTIGNSTFHSFQMRVQKRFSAGLSFLASYTNAKLITDADAAETFLGPNAAFQDLYNLRLEKSVGAMDVSQRLVVSLTYELPFGRKKFIGANWHPVVNAVFGGWQVNGIMQFQGGFPIAIQTQSNSSQSIGAGTQRPNSNGKSAKLSAGRPTQAKLDKWFDTSVFSQPALFTFGNLGRVLPDVRTDGANTVDASLFKNFRIGERAQIQFRAEFFNALNTPQFGMPNTSYGAALFGTVSDQSNVPRQIQMGLKIRF